MNTRPEWRRQVGANARCCDELQRRLAQLSITETSRDGTVRVTVATTGLLTGLVLTERRQPVPPARLAETIMACVRQAQARIPDLMGQVMAETVGRQDPAAQLILAQTRARFPGTPPQRHASTGPADAHDWGSGPILEFVERRR